MLLIDNSAWARRRLPPARERLAAAMEAGDIAVCLPFLLEAGYSARSGGDHSALLADLALLPRVEIDSDVERLGLRALIDAHTTLEFESDWVAPVGSLD